MSTNCPPQLQLSIDIQPSTTSFKRSFEQFGFDLDSPVITGPEDLIAETTDLDTAAMDGNVEGRSTGIGVQPQNASRRGNKRPRSASSFSSESSSSASASSGRSGLRSEASTSSSASSTSSAPSVHHPSSIRPQNRTRIQLLSPSPPRLPTPEIQDIEMPTEYSPTTESVIGDHHQHHSHSALLPIPIPTTTHAAHASSMSFVPHVHHPQPHPASSSSPPPPQQPTTEDMFRLSLERFNAFDTEISALRQADNPASLSLSLGLGLMPISNAAGGMRATTPRLISPTSLSVDPHRSRTPPPTLPLLPIQVAAEGENESAMILPEMLPIANMTPAVAAVPISASAPSSSSSPISPSHTNRGTASTAASNTTTNALDFHVPTSPFGDNFFMQEGLRTSTLITAEEEEDEESFEDDGEQSSFRFREHLQDHLRDRRRSRMPFRDHLDTALARLRSRSPLVPGIGDGGSISSEASGERQSDSGEEGRRGEDHWEEAVEHEEGQSEEYESAVVPPPTLPPIPTIATGSTSAQDPWEGGFFSTSGLGGGETSTTSTTIPATTRTRTPTTAMGLSDHPLPSPILRDLHSWMGVGEGESGPTSGGGANRSSGISGQPERHYAHPITNFNSTIIVNPTITSSNLGGTSNNNTSTTARASSPSTSTTSTSTVRPSSVSGGGGFAGFAGFGGSASEVSAPSQSTYQSSSIFGGGGNSGRSGADDLRLTDPRLSGEIGQGEDGFVGSPHEYPPEIWSASPYEALAAMAAYVTRSNPQLRERRSWSPPPLAPPRFAAQPYESQSSAPAPVPVPWYRNVTDASTNATTSNSNSDSNSSSSSSSSNVSMTATATNVNNNTSASASPSLFGAWEPLGSSTETLEAGFGNWPHQQPEQIEGPRSREEEEAEEESSEEEGEEDEDVEMEDEDDRDRRLRAEILSTRRLPRPEEFSAGFSSSLTGAVGETQSQNRESIQARVENSNSNHDSPLRRTTTTTSNSSRSYQRSMRPGSSNSLVTESAAEVRRQADRAQAEEWASGRRREPAARSPWPHLQGILTAEGETQLRDSPWGAELLERIGATEQNRRSRSRSSSRADLRRPLIPPPRDNYDSLPRVVSDPVMRMDEAEDAPPRRNSETLSAGYGTTFETFMPTQPVYIPRSPSPRTPILDFFSRPNYFPRQEAVTPTDPPPSLPPPDFGGRFDSEPQIQPSNSNSQAFAPPDQNDRSNPSGFWRSLRPHVPWIRPQVPSTNDRDGNINHAIPPSPRPPFVDRRLSVSSRHEEPERTRFIVDEAQGSDDEDDSDDDNNMMDLERVQRTLHTLASLARSSQTQAELSPTRPTIPSNPFSSNSYLDSIWSDGAGNGSGPGRTQRETTSHGHTLPQPPLAPSSYTIDTFDPSSFAPGPFRNTVQQLVDDRERDRLRGTATSTSNSVPITSQPSSFETRLLERTRMAAAPPPRRFPPRMAYRPPNPPPPSIPPLSFGGDDGAERHGGGTDMDVVDMGFNPSPSAATSRPATAENTVENPNTSRARRFSSYARGLGSAIPISNMSPGNTSVNDGRGGRESGYGRRSFIPMGPSSSGVANASSLRVNHPQSTASSDMHRYISAQARMADALSETSRPSAASAWSNTLANNNPNNNTPLDPNAPVEPFTPYTPFEAGRRRQLPQRHSFDRLRQRERERERDARSASTAANSNSNSSSFRPSFPPTNTASPAAALATTAAAAAARMAFAEQSERRDERLMSLQAHMSRGRRARFGGTVGGTAPGASNSSNNTRSGSGTFPSATSSNVPPQHQHPLTLQNFQHWHSLQTDSPGWTGPGGDGPGAGSRRGRGGRAARVLGDYMRDEDFDESYESLISLAAALGDAKPRGAPSEIVEKMEKGKYKDWKTEGSDVRCPICLDDYEPDDPVLKLSNCSHWLHHTCLHQWLETASTCPVCRKSVNNNSSGSGSSFARRHHHHLHAHHRPFGALVGAGAGMNLGSRRRERETTNRDPPSGPVIGAGGREEVGRRPGPESAFARFSAGRGGTGAGRNANGGGGGGRGNGNGGNGANANEQNGSGNNDDSTSGSRWGAPGWEDAPWR